MIPHENRTPSVRYFDALPSTNDYLRERWQEEDDWLVVRAGCQTKGHGRLQRPWASPLGGLWFSILFKNAGETPSHYQRLLGVSALRAIEAIDGEAGVFSDLPRTGNGKGFNIKWPNDIVYTSGGPGVLKVAGVLQENLILGEAKAYIVGIGINVNNPIPPELQGKAVSLRALFSRDVSIEDLFRAILQEVSAWRSDAPGVLHLWRQRSLLQRGSLVEIYAEAEGVSFSGEVVETPVESIEILCSNGQRRRFFAGEVRLRALTPTGG